MKSPFEWDSPILLAVVLGCERIFAPSVCEAFGVVGFFKSLFYWIGKVFGMIDVDG